MDVDFIIEEEGERKKPAAPTLTGWETVVFEVADETEEMVAGDVEEWLVERWF
jgi:hypothetical protein